MTICDKKDQRGKIARWLIELEEYEFDLVHLPGKENVKADFMSRSNHTAFPPAGRLEENVYAVVNESFRTQLKTEQNSDVIIKQATDELVNNDVVSTGRLKRVTKQLRMKDGVLTKSDRPVIPRKMYDYVTSPRGRYQVALWG